MGEALRFHERTLATDLWVEDGVGRSIRIERHEGVMANRANLVRRFFLPNKSPPHAEQFLTVGYLHVNACRVCRAVCTTQQTACFDVLASLQKSIVD